MRRSSAGSVFLGGRIEQSGFWAVARGAARKSTRQIAAFHNVDIKTPPETLVNPEDPAHARRR
jgi:hypothetical protein